MQVHRGVEARHLDYLRRAGIKLPAVLPQPPGPAERRRDRVRGVGVIEDDPWLGHAAAGRRQPTESLLNALFGQGIGVAFEAGGVGGETEICLGTWSDQPGRRGVDLADRHRDVLAGILRTLFPVVELTPPSREYGDLRSTGLVLGNPDAAPPGPGEEPPLDKLLRAMGGHSWAYLVLASPAGGDVAAKWRDEVINEIRIAEQEAIAERVPKPLAEEYTNLLRAALGSLTVGLGTGLWRTAVYLMGDAASYYRLAATWQGIYAGQDSLVPIRVWENPGAFQLAHRWARPEDRCPPADGPGRLQHPWLYQTLLTSAQLAAYVHFPKRETRGFSVEAVFLFDVEPPTLAPDAATVAIGEVTWAGKPDEDAVGAQGKVAAGKPVCAQDEDAVGAQYKVAVNSLARHVFVAGVPGSGKTNTVFHLLKEVTPHGPFLVIEPAKTEYRALLQDAELKRSLEEAGRGPLQVFTLGDELTAPFRMNPLEVMPGRDGAYPVGAHMDLLRALFNASFVMWAPLPEALEQCLREAYEDYGWDLTLGRNSRLDGRQDPSAAFPTLADLYNKVEEAVGRMKYEGEAKGNIPAALRARINSLRTGSKGRMLDTRHSLTSEELFGRPTVLEIEKVGSDEDKAFLMGLVVMRLVEYWQQQGESEQLRHLLVLEEAHRLLSRPEGPGRADEANARAKGVETFSNLLAEMRAYGQGIVISDQSPGRLVPDVIKNTGLKIGHRIVDAQDRALLGRSMALREYQLGALATLKTGEALVFSEGDDAPVRVQVEKVKKGGIRVSFDPRRPPPGTAEEESARLAVEDPLFQEELVRLVLSVTESADAFDRQWPDLIGRAQKARRRNDDGGLFHLALCRLASESLARDLGRRAGWSYSETARLESRLSAMLSARLEAETPVGQGKALADAVKAFRDCMHEIHRRGFDPFPGCDLICGKVGGGGTCLYRHAVAPRVEPNGARLLEEFEAAFRQGSERQEGLRRPLTLACEFAVRVVGSHAELRPAARRAAFCYLQHVLSRRSRSVGHHKLKEWWDSDDLRDVLKKLWASEP